MILRLLSLSQLFLPYSRSNIQLLTEHFNLGVSQSFWVQHIHIWIHDYTVSNNFFCVSCPNKFYNHLHNYPIQIWVPSVILLSPSAPALHQLLNQIDSIFFMSLLIFHTHFYHFRSSSHYSLHGILQQYLNRSLYYSFATPQIHSQQCNWTHSFTEFSNLTI
jgi:hypothetical protein